LNTLKSILIQTLQACGVIFILFLICTTFVLLHDRSRFRLGRYLKLNDANGHAHTILPRNIVSITDDFANPHLIKVWMDNGNQIFMPIESRIEIEKAMK
jgi:hypothetical protein